MSAVKSIGFEIEGGWDGTIGVSPFKDISLIHDHSINGQTLEDRRIVACHIGEAVSPPFLLEDDWVGWLTSHWPNAEPPNRANNTCGFHIHVATHSKRDYSLLTYKSFLFYLRDRMMLHGQKVDLPKSHNFWKRMDGFNRFCQLDFNPAAQICLIKTNGVQNTRYGWLNYSWRAHGTIEFRALPTFRDASVGKSFAVEYVRTIDDFLAGCSGRSIEFALEER